MLVLSVVISVIIGTLGWFGFASGDVDAGQRVDATVLTGAPCGQPEAREVVRFQQDGRERQARFDGCGHQEGEPVAVRVPSTAENVIVQAVGATTGEGDDGRKLGLLLLVLSGIVGGGYGVLMQPELRSRLGPLRPGDLSRLLARLTRRGSRPGQGP